MADIKGVLLNAWVEYLKNRYGVKAVASALESVRPEDRHLLSSPFLPSSWYPYDALHSLRRLTRSLMTSPEPNFSFEIGSFLAQYVFTGVYRSLLAKDAISQVNKFSSIGDFFFHEARKLDTEIRSDSSCLVRYTYEKGAAPTHAICESLMGFWSRTLDLAGASQVKSAHPKCVTRGADCCEFTFDWT